MLISIAKLRHVLVTCLLPTNNDFEYDVIKTNYQLIRIFYLKKTANKIAKSQSSLYQVNLIFQGKL